MRHRSAVGVEKFPGNAPFVRAQFGLAAREFHGGRVEIGEAALRVRRLNSGREGVEHCAQVGFVFPQGAL